MEDGIPLQALSWGPQGHGVPGILSLRKILLIPVSFRTFLVPLSQHCREQFALTFILRGSYEAPGPCSGSLGVEGWPSQLPTSATRCKAPGRGRA